MRWVVLPLLVSWMGTLVSSSTVQLVPRKSVKESFGNYVVDRKTGKQFYESMSLPVRLGMKALFSMTGVVSTRLMRNQIMKQTFARGHKYDSPDSVKDIPKFVKQFKLNLQELLNPDLSSYKTYNEFFYRKLRPDARPIANDTSAIVSAADCRLNVFHSVDQAKEVWIKGKAFTLDNLFQSQGLARVFDGGAVAIFRLAPQDYHRFHSPVDATVESIKPIDGTYFTVNPMAVRSKLNVFTENKRVLITLNSPQVGKVAFVCIGAMMVGSIVLSIKEGQTINKGDEVGYFAFGGSTILTVFEKGKLMWDTDLAKNSAEALETLVQMGERIGSAR